MWFCCYSLGCRSRERIVIAPAYRSGRFLHASLIELHRFLSHTAWSSRKCCSIHFLSLSAVRLLSASMMVLGESQTLHQVATGPIAGKFATFSLNFALNPLLCSAVQPSSTRQFCILSNPINSIQCWWRGRSASSSNPSFGGSNLSIRDLLQRVWIPAVLSLLPDCYCRISIYPIVW
jgi:hypothetical protein